MYNCNCGQDDCSLCENYARSRQITETPDYTLIEAEARKLRSYIGMSSEPTIDEGDKIRLNRMGVIW